MLKRIICLIFLLKILFPSFIKGQDISLFNQLNGRYDFTFIGNTMNPAENLGSTPNFLYTSTSANLTLQSSDTIIAAYLYWAGIGTGDTSITLNNIPITPDILSNIIGTSSNLVYFSAFTDVTSQIQSTGNGIYTIADFDLNNLITQYDDNSTQFGGWAILVVYENPALTLNQINIYQGLEALSPNININPPFVDSKTIDLNNLYLISNTGAKIGFIAWEGDRFIDESEQLSFTSNGNTNILSNSINPSDNAFNGTNTETNSIVLYNMDLDVYSIENYIVPGTTSASVSLQSGQDYVMLNTIVTKLNSQLPDATIVTSNPITSCNSREITIDFTVSNTNSTEVLQSNTPITFYADGIAVGTTYTQNAIPIGGSENGSFTLTIPSSVLLNFNLLAVVDDTGNGIGIVTELNENNNNFELPVELIVSPEFNPLENLISCNLGFTRGFFDFSSYEEMVKTDINQNVSFHEFLDDATNNINPINNTSNYEAFYTPKEIFIRIEDEHCYSITSFNLLTRNCPPTIYNAVSANNDFSNDVFFIDGLRDIFVNFELEIYNRWGKHLWTGNQNKPDWDGTVPDGIGNQKATAGTYFYILYLNDQDYPEPLTGYLYLTY